ncbi:MAG: deoxyribonuclease IV [Carbonactinosporaceae bacterium]
MLPIGAHVDQADPIGEAEARGADLVQFFLGDPQGWRPRCTYEGGTRALRAAAQARGVDMYIHAPYLVNVASTNNRIRIPSRKILQTVVDEAAELGAAAVIVHGGHVGKADDLDVGLDNWRKAMERLEMRCPVYVENTAGGEKAMARTVESIGRLWDALDGHDVGFCLDTCHAHAGGEELAGIVDRIKALTGRVDLVHANDSKDAFASGRDRHENLGSGHLDPGQLVDVVTAAGAPVVCETPGGAEGQHRDITWLRGRLPD